MLTAIEIFNNMANIVNAYETYRANLRFCVVDWTGCLQYRALEYIIDNEERIKEYFFNGFTAQKTVEALDIHIGKYFGFIS